MVVDICRQCLAAKVIAKSNLLCPERVGGVVRNPEHGGVLLPNYDCPTMVVAFSSLLTLPTRYGCSSSSFVCLLNREDGSKG
jgi:hypothetical protein